MNMDKSVTSFLQSVINKGDPEDFRKLKDGIQGTDIRAQELTRIWYGTKSLSECSDKVLEVLSKILGGPEAAEEDVKSLFLVSKTKSTQVNCRTAFNACRAYEEKHGVDIGEMQREQILEDRKSVV